MNILQNKWKKIMKLALSFIMLTTVMDGVRIPIVHAVDETKMITAFANISDEIKQQQIPQGETQSRVTLPETLSVTVKDVSTNVSKEEVVKDITWKLDTERSASDTFDTRKAMNGDNYTYVAVLPKGYDLAITVELPRINVRIKSAIQRKGTVKTVTRESSSTQSFAGGTGTLEDPYQIATADQLYYFASLVNSGNDSICATLMNDITLNKGTFTIDGNKNPLLDGTPVDNNAIRNWTPIASAQRYPINSDGGYKGTFSGNDHTISGLYINKDYTDIPTEFSGLFGKVNGGTVKDITIKKSYIRFQNTISNSSKGSGIGGIAAFSTDGTLIENCMFSGFIIGSGSSLSVGGIVGYGLSDTTIKKCNNVGYVDVASDASYVGGIVGNGTRVNIIECQNTGEIKYDTLNQRFTIYGVGSLCGNSGDSTIKKSWNTGKVKGIGNNVSVGGLVGVYNNQKGTAYISDCYNAGDLTVSYKDDSFIVSIGGLIGVLGADKGGMQMEIKNSYNAGKLNSNNAFNAGSMIGQIRNSNVSVTLNNTYFDKDIVPYQAIGYTQGTVTEEAIEKSTKEFKSGEVAYKLNASRNEDNGVSSLAWYQNLGAGGDVYPVQDATRKKVCKKVENDVITYLNAYPCIISASSKTKDGKETDIQLNGLGKHLYGDKISLEAPVSTGYNFVGWYLSSSNGLGYTGEVLEKNRVYPLTVTGDKDLVAVYEGIGKADVTISASDKSYMIDGVEHTGTDTSAYAIGKTMTVAVKEPTNFLYWQNDYGMIVSREASYTFTVTGKASLTAIYDVQNENEATVIYESHYGQAISKKQIKKGDPVTLPQGPARYGYTFEKWSLTTKEIEDKIAAGEKIIYVTPEYVLDNESFAITVVNGTGTGNYKMNDVVTVMADKAAPGKKFSHWTDGDGKIVSYQMEYQFYAAKNMTVTANYVNDGSVVEEKGTATIIDIKKDKVNLEISFVSMLTVPNGCKMKMAGIIATSDEAVGTSGEGFNKDSASRVRGDAWTGNAYRYTWTVKTRLTYYVRPYLVYEDQNGNIITMYGTMVQGSPLDE